MKKFVSITMAIGLVTVLGVVANQVVADDHSLAGRTVSPGIGPGVGGSYPDAQEQLFRGDMIAEQGLGCSNATGNSGGPNDWAVGVTATLTPPMGIIQTTYNVFTQNGYVTQMAFKAFTAAGGPGATIGSQALTAAQYAAGTHTVAISPFIPLTNQAFFFGFNQPQTLAGMRIGLDTSSGGSGFSYLLAPGCGLASWGTVTSIGFNGDWVMRVLVDDTVPVELQMFSVE